MPFLASRARVYRTFQVSAKVVFKVLEFHWDTGICATNLRFATTVPSESLHNRFRV